MKFPPGPHGINWPSPYSEAPMTTPSEGEAMLELAVAKALFQRDVDEDVCDGTWDENAALHGRILADARAAITAIRAAAQSSSGVREWQPIETAPRDGTYILAGWRGSPAVNRLHKHEDRWTDGHGVDDFMTPTHWMPLPASPDTPREGKR